MEIHICSITEYDAETRMPTIVNPDSSTFYLVPTEDGTSPDLFTEWVYVNGAWEMFGSAKIDLSGYLTDVQINGTSIVENGVANVPYGTNNAYGVVKGAESKGLNIVNGTTEIRQATSTLIKEGTYGYTPICPQRQHISTFYGLAKSAGDTTQSHSSNAVGNYTDEAKQAIAEMLGLPYERLIYRDDTFGNVWNEYQPIDVDFDNNAIILDDATGIPTDDLSPSFSAYLVYKPLLNLQYGNLPTELIGINRIKNIGDNKIQFFNSSSNLITFTDTSCIDMSKCKLLFLQNDAIQERPYIDGLISTHKYHARFTYYGWLPDASGIYLNSIRNGSAYNQNNAVRRDRMLGISRSDGVFISTSDQYSCAIGNRYVMSDNIWTHQMSSTFGQMDIWIEPSALLNGHRYKTECVSMCANTNNKTNWMEVRFANGQGILNEPLTKIGLTANDARYKFANGCIFEVWDCGTHF